MANPRKFSEKIALHNQKQAEETAAFEKIMREVSDATNKPEEVTLATQYGMGGGRSGGASPSRSPTQRGRASSSVGPMRRPADRRHDTSPYGSTVYLSPPPDSNWRRTNSDSALHQSCGDAPAASQPLSPHHPLHSHAHPHTQQNHRRANDIHLDVLGALGMNPANRPRSSCEIPRIPNNTNVYSSGDGGGGGGGLACGELQVPGGSLPDLTSVHYPYLPQREQDYQNRYQSPTSPGAVSPAAGSGSPATGGLSPASGSPVGATVPLQAMHHPHDHTQLYEQNHLSVPNTNNYLHHNKNQMSPLDHNWIPSSCYQAQCSPPSQYSSTSNINIPSPTMVHSPGSPAESPQTDYSLHSTLLQPFEQITMLDSPVSSYNATYINHSSPQTTNSQHTYPQSPGNCGAAGSGSSGMGPARARDPVPGGGPFLPPLASPATPTPTPPSIPDIILTDHSFADYSEEAALRAELDLDDLTLLDQPGSLLPDSAVEHELFDRL
ncbi:CREB-regulated transcription coactivator 3 isoform X1 [Leguminivora glycinivorella]|uniref:CREB-regulated transcription coactivator 3 isoform X1 n=2 Tax=Leguminivora glycinivorella TaxID=1035111 RepID=UPI00200EA1E4|nr:CREB-regulated transcription coactivator 3 isoform X1 [Leguminivora glycinivorella]